MKRKHTARYRTSDHRNDDLVPGTPADRISFVWPLTREIVSLSKKHDAERRLQRHVTRLGRREGRTKDLADAEALESLRNSGQIAPPATE